MTATGRDPLCCVSDLGNNVSKCKFRNSLPHHSQQALCFEISLSHYMKRQKKNSTHLVYYIEKNVLYYIEKNVFFIPAHCFQNFSNKCNWTTKASQTRGEARSLPPAPGKRNCFLGSFCMAPSRQKYAYICSVLEFHAVKLEFHRTWNDLDRVPGHMEPTGCDAQTDLSELKCTFALGLVHPKHDLSVNHKHNTVNTAVSIYIMHYWPSW